MHKECEMSENEKNKIIEAHKYSINHRSTILKDEKCGCFYCLKIFDPAKIAEWIEDNIDGTAICPYCGIDSIIGESSGFPITKEFLLKMNEYWFGRCSFIDDKQNIEKFEKT